MTGSESALVSGQGNPADAETPLAYRAVRGGIWVALSSYWNIGFSFAATVVLTRLLDPEAFGQFAYAMFFAQLLSLSPKLGLNYAFVQHRETTDETIATYVLMESLAAVGTVLLTLLARPFLPDTVFLICLVMAVSAVAGLGGVCGVLLEKELQLGRTSLIQSIVTPVSYLPAFLLALSGAGAWSLVASAVAQGLLYSALILWLVRGRLPRIWRARARLDLGLARQWLRFGIAAGLAVSAGTLLTTLDNFLIGAFVGATTLGYYDRAYRTAQWPSMLITNMVARTSFYTYAKLQDDLERLQKTATMILWLISLLALPIALVIFIAGPDLLVMLYGERWLPSTPYLRILVLVSAVRPAWENAYALFVATGKPQLMLKFTLIQVAALAVAGLPLTMAWGALGTCVAVGIAFAVGMLTLYRAVVREVPIAVTSVFGAPALAFILTSLGYLAFNRLAELNDLDVPVRVLIKVAFAIAAYFAITFLLQPTTVKERVAYLYRLARGQRGE